MNSRTLVAAIAGVCFATSAAAQAPALPVGVGQTGRVPDAEKSKRSAEYLSLMKDALKQALVRVEEARNEKDVVKLNCVNEKLTQMKALLKVAEAADVAMHEAITAKAAGADAQYSKIVIARSKIDILRGEAERCIGQLAYAVDEKAKVDVKVPPDLPREDQENEREGRGVQASPFTPPPVERAPSASPVQ